MKNKTNKNKQKSSDVATINLDKLEIDTKNTRLIGYKKEKGKYIKRIMIGNLEDEK